MNNKNNKWQINILKIEEDLTLKHLKDYMENFQFEQYTGSD